MDTLRLRDPEELRRVLHGYPGLPDAAGPPAPPQQNHQQTEVGGDRKGDGVEGPDSNHGGGDDGDGDGAGRREENGSASKMPELLAALSRAVEEEIRGSRGLFGLETGVLERLKGGARVTPFLRHGSVRRRESMGAAPHGLAAGGMKKWWRCPRCHVSQVIRWAILTRVWESLQAYSYASLC